MRENARQDAPWVVTFAPGESLEEKLKKAAHVKPSPAQLAWMEKEYIAFVHYGPNVFSGTQWGTGKESVSDYNPSGLDVAQWCDVCAQAGMKMMVFTAKHHDGFCQWHTQTTDFSIENTPAGEDIVAGLQAGCKKHGMELGVYLSPWDMHQREKGGWGTEPYNAFFLQQLHELLTLYGPIGEVWFDGACADYAIWQPVPCYTPQSWYDLIEELQPSAVVRLYDPHSLATQEEWQGIREGNARLQWSGKGVRWVGNEGGTSRRDEWSVQPVFDRLIGENATWSDLGQEQYYTDAVGAVWYPLEVNTVVLNQWFWNEKTSTVRSLEDLIQVYYDSVGNNGVLLLNISPDKNGVVDAEQVQRLMELKTFVENTFRENLARKAVVTASEEAPGYPAQNVLDGNKTTCWTTENTWRLEHSTASLTVELEKETTFDNVMLQELICEGQRVAQWSLEIWADGAWREVVRRKTIGYKRIERFPAVTASKVRLQILRSWDRPMIRSFGLYRSDPLPERKEPPAMPAVALSPIPVEAGTLRQGLPYSLYEGGLQSAALLDSVFAAKRIKTGVAPKVDTGCADRPIGYSVSYAGFLHVPADGTYTFHLESTDGSLLYLGEHLFISNDEPHQRKTAMRMAVLQHGYYPIKVLYTSFRNPGLLRLFWEGPAVPLQEIAPVHFWRDEMTAL